MAAARNAGDVDVAQLFWTAFWMGSLMGLIGAAVIYVGGTLYFGSMAQMDPGFEGEVSQAMPLVAAMVPILMLGSPLGGALQAREKFLAANGLSLLGNTLLALLPLLFAYLWKTDLTAVVAGALAARLIVFPLAYWLCQRAVPLAMPRRPSLRMAKDLLGFGSWMSLSAITNGVLGTIDRLAIGGTLGAAAVSAYSIPYSLVSRVILIPHSLGSVLFPRFAYVDEGERGRLLSSSIQAVAVLTTPIIIALLAITEPFFAFWIGPELAPAAPIAYALATGFWVYCIGYPSFSMLQAIGRPDLVSKLFLAELIPYCAALFVGMWVFGLIGVAIVLTARFLAETFFILRLAAVPLSSLRFLIWPALLMFASVAAVIGVPAPLRYLVLALLLASSIVWSALHVPEALQPLTRRFSWLLPWRRQ
jgi:O-antigen/teichoic acid export membrane protein